MASRWKTAIKAAARVHGYRIFRRFLSRSQHWDGEARDRYVLERLRATLVGAAEHVPFYRRLFRDAGFDPRSDLRAPADVARLPTLTKEDVRRHYDALLDRRHLAFSIEAQTSGTTGEPLRMRLNESYVAFDSACLFRHWSWAGYTWRRPMVALRSYVPEGDSEPTWRYSRAQNTLFMSAYHLTPASCDEYIDRILAFRPEFVRAYPSSAALFAEYAYPRREQLGFIKGIFTASETLVPSERETIERTFGRKLFDWYGMTEPVMVITECERHEGMHINWEYGFPELVAAPDLPPNEFRLIATGFHNPVMPFIRYDTGDIVRVDDPSASCPCGRNMPLVKSIAGRKDECIVTPDGRRLPSVNFYTVFRKYTDIMRFQLAQYGHRDVVARVQMRPDVTAVAAVLDRLREELKSRLGPEIALDVMVAERLLTNADGKTPPIVRRAGTRAVEDTLEYAISAQTAWTRFHEGRTVHKLDWNESDIVPSRRVREALVALLARDEYVCWYPDAVSADLVGRIATYAGADTDNVALTHGSDQAMEAIATAFVQRGDRVVIVAPCYDNFRAIVDQHGASVTEFRHGEAVALDVTTLEAVVTERPPRLVYVNNPNNPIGYAVELPVLRRLAETCRRVGAILIVDEAYYEFCGISAVPLLRDGFPVAVLRTFSKAFGLAGLRIGYVLAAGEVMRALRRVLNPKHVTMLAKAGAVAALDDVATVQAHIEHVGAGRALIYECLSRRGVAYRESRANFVLFHWDRADELVRFLESRDIMVRDRTRYFEGRGTIRITVGAPAGVASAVAALNEYFDAHVPADA